MREILAKASSYGVQIIRAPREFLNTFGLKEQDVAVGYPCLESTGLWLVKKGDVSQLLFSVPSLGSNLTGQAGQFQGKVFLCPAVHPRTGCHRTTAAEACTAG